MNCHLKEFNIHHIGVLFQKENSESVWLYKDLNEYDTYSDTEDETSGKWIFLINAVDGSTVCNRRHMKELKAELKRGEQCNGFAEY